MKKSIKSLGLVGVLFAGSAWASQEETVSGPSSTLGLEPFIEARILETSGRYRDAMRAYERALREEPSLLEIRVRYASLLVELGLAGRAVEVLDVVGDLDWYGRRVRALALAQHSSRNEKFLGEAEVALRAALAEREDDPNLQLSLGQVLQRMGRPADAEEVIAHLRATRGGSPQLVAYHASLLKELGRSQEAAELYAECAAASHVGGRECRENLVQLLVELGRPGEAGEVMLRWLGDDDLDELMHAASLLYEGGRYDQALRTVQRVLRQAQNSPRAHRLRAYILSSLGRFREAAAVFRDLVREDRENLDLLLATAWATVNSGDLDGARKWIARAWEVVRDDSGSPEASRVALAAARVELVGDHTALAREWIDRVVDYGEFGEDVVFLVAETYRRDEQWSDGIAALLRLQPRLQEGRARQAALAFEAEFRLRIDDQRAWPLLRRSLDSDSLRDVLTALQILQSLERWEDVEREAAAALERLPEVRDLRFTRAAALERMGRVGEADVLFRTLVEQDPSDAAAANYLGYSLADRGTNLDEALQLISRAVALEPENSAYLDSLGWVHYRLGDLDQAEYWLRRAVGFGDSDGTILSHLGEVLLRRGDSDEARRMLQHALDLGCEHPDHIRGLLAGDGDGE
jgi:Flp pilus assembly protein TadD